MPEMYNTFTLIILKVYSKHTFLDCNQNSSIKKLPLNNFKICIVKGYYMKKDRFTTEHSPTY